ncbi:MAG TPA: flagellar basal body L-ring protein FlgH [candidate division Zixibacteria bacterium]|nr:flagellar basal body L-ring protein FlgH [candidate division Zixibacteria bacterium]
MRSAAFLVLVFSLLGCAPALQKRFFPRPTAPEMAREVDRLSQTEVAAQAQQSVSPGSLWPEDDRVFFYADKKALRVGDIVTIRIVESAEASNTADTDLSRSSSANASLSAFFGRKKFLNLFKLGEDLLTASSENSHQGSGSTTRSGQLVATMTAVVRDVLPNGNLVVEGTREVLVNHEQQFITLTGIVRPQDISRDNTVLSTQVADANISIGGLGVVADKQRSGWGTWIFDFIWPF